jgi:hypothetical protein
VRQDAVHDPIEPAADGELACPARTTRLELGGAELSRQIAEAHDDSLTLENRGADSATGRRPGCTALVRLPLARG